jgi:hypothetical protein
MPKAKQASRRKRGREVTPALGLVGMSLSMVGAASAAGVPEPVSNIPFKDTATAPGINLTEEEVSDVSLGTFYVFDKENADTPKTGQVAQRGCGGCRGCRGCGRGCRGCGGGGCGGCGGCGCCLSWGACRIC